MGSLDVGTVIGDRYELQEPAAAGATATVWAAYDEFLRRRVAVKVLHEHLREDHSLVDRFADEARTAAGVSHPSLVAVYDTIASPPAMVMEWIDGPDLRRRLADGPLAPTEAAAIGATVCDALAALHRHGLVHRDVKPANVLIAADGTPKLTDFGIATANAGDRTATGVVLGTAKYLAPEQVRGQQLDGRADLFALACVLYEAVSGRPPWQRDGDLPTALARLEDEPEPLPPDVPGDLAAAIFRGLARDPAQRWATAQDFAAALRGDATASLSATHHRRRAATSAPAPATSPSLPDALPSAAPRRRRWVAAVTTAVAVAAVAGLGVVLITAADDGGAPSRPAQPIFTALSFDPEGSGPAGENDELLARAVDDDPSTGWPTESYRDRTFGTKSGVGLVLVLEETADVRELAVDTADSRGWAADVRVTTMSATDFESARDPADFGPIVGGGIGLDSPATIPATGRGNVVLLWLTDLGDGPLPIRLVINEIVVR